MEISDICRKKTWERRVDKAKKKDRPKLKNWSRGGFCFTRKLELQNYFSQTFRNNNLLVSDNKQLFTYNFPPIPRFSCSNITVEGFINKYEKNYIPCIIEGIPAAEGWKAVEKWSFKYFKIFGKRYFKVGEDDDGYKVKLRMKYFLTYMKKNQDDSPLYIFDGNFDTDPVSKQLLQEYKVPSYFPDDLFSLVGEKRRPPYRWFLVGPARSGTCIHIDPLGTSAWNTLLQGIKRWVLIPPGVKKNIVKGTDFILKGEDDEAINYFVDIVPRMERKYGSNLQIVQFLQYPGDTVFIPGGWWHAVLNVTDTIAVTQNFCSHSNFEKVWIKTRSGRKKMSMKWLSQLKIHYPHLAELAEELNKQDNFVMNSKESKHEMN